MIARFGVNVIEQLHPVGLSNWKEHVHLMGQIVWSHTGEVFAPEPTNTEGAGAVEPVKIVIKRV